MVLFRRRRRGKKKDCGSTNEGVGKGKTTKGKKRNAKGRRRNTRKVDLIRRRPARIRKASDRKKRGI